MSNSILLPEFDGERHAEILNFLATPQPTTDYDLSLHMWVMLQQVLLFVLVRQSYFRIIRSTTSQME